MPRRAALRAQPHGRAAPATRRPSSRSPASSASEAVEIRNDLAGNAILDGTPPARIRALAEAAGVRILSINALQRFDDWRRARGRTRRWRSPTMPQACGAEALVLVPSNDGTPPGPAASRRWRGCGRSWRRGGSPGWSSRWASRPARCGCKSEAVAAIAAVDGGDDFRLVHDTFHHHLAGEAALFPALTGLVHISGVDRPGARASAEMRDAHRGAGDGGGPARQRRADPRALRRRLRRASSRSSRSRPRCSDSPTRPRRSAGAWISSRRGR